MRRFWEIRGWKGTEKIFEKKCLMGYFEDLQIENTLKALTAKASLDYDEIVDSYSKKNSKIYKPLLEVRKSGRQFTIMCGLGTDVAFTARLIQE